MPNDAPRALGARRVLRTILEMMIPELQEQESASYHCTGLTFVRGRIFSIIYWITFVSEMVAQTPPFHGTLTSLQRPQILRIWSLLSDFGRSSRPSCHTNLDATVSRPSVDRFSIFQRQSTRKHPVFEEKLLKCCDDEQNEFILSKQTSNFSIFSHSPTWPMCVPP